MKKYNTMILLIALALIVSHLIGICQQVAVSHLSLDEYLSGKVYFTRVSIILNLLAFLPAAIWAYRNSPNQLNKFISFILILLAGFVGALILLILDGIACLNDNKTMPNQRVDPTVKTPVESGNEQGTAGHP